MKCKRCGAELLDTDTFCVKCGQKVSEPAKCPVCGEPLREGTRFCHKCGAEVQDNAEPEDDEIPVTPTKTVDIPFDMIEKSIIMEAEQAVVKRDFSEAEARQEQEKRKAQSGMAAGEEQSQERQPHPSKVVEAVRNGNIYDLHGKETDDTMYDDGDDREQYDDGDYENESDDRGYSDERDDDQYDDRYDDREYEEDYDDGDYDDQDEKKFFGRFDLTKITIILGIIVVLVVLIGSGMILKKKLNFAFGSFGNSTTSQQSDDEGTGASSGEVAGKLQIIKNVNMRDQPSTENSNVLGVAKAGEVYEYYELVSDNWYRIRLSDGSEAYVYKEYVEILS